MTSTSTGVGIGTAGRFVPIKKSKPHLEARLRYIHTTYINTLNPT
jgi:hypothetical protein